MPLHLPDFRQEYLCGISWCSILNSTAFRIGELPIRLFSRYRATAANEDVLFVVLIEADDDASRLHFHVDIDRVSVARNTEGLAEVPVDELKRTVEQLLGLEGYVFATARYAVPRKSLPRRGMIATLLGVETQSCGASLELKGAKFALDGDFFTEMEWSYTDGTDCVSGELSGESETVINDESFTEMADLLQSGIDCFVLEKTEGDVTNADDSSVRKKAQG